MSARTIWPIVMATALAFACGPLVASENVPIHVALSARSAPLLGQESEVTATVTADWDLPNVTLEIELPTEGKVVAQPKVSLASVAAGIPLDCSARVVFATPGNKLVRAVVKAIVSPDVSWSAVAYMGMNVGTTSSTVGLGPVSILGAAQKTAGTGRLGAELPVWSPGPAPAPPARAAGTGGPEGPSASRSSAEATLGIINVSGSWHFNDRFGTYTPMRELLVELRRSDTGAHIAWSWCDWNGNYTFSGVTNPYPVGVYVVASTWDDYGGGNFISIIDAGGDEWDNRYQVATGTVYFSSDGNVSMGNWMILDTWANRKAWWIYDDYVKAYFVPRKPDSSYDLTGRHVGRWTPTSTDGTYYNPGGDAHYMAGDADNTPDTILHEMGHSVMYNIYGGYMPPFPNCNPHYLRGSSSTGCGWTEGWAQTWHCWTTNDPIRSYPGGGSVNLETATWGTPDWDNGDTVEGRVAGAIWDITDPTNDGYDTYSGSWADVWEVMRNVTCDTFAGFWSQWKSRGHPKHGPVACIYQCTIDYNTWPDFFGLPDIVTDEDTPINNAIDLWVHAYDPESEPWELTYQITGNTDPSCGVTIDSGDYVDVNPALNWYGTSTVTISCTDGIRTRSDSFLVTVNSVPDAPIMSSLPTYIDYKNGNWQNVVHLPDITTDAETPSDLLTYTIWGNTNPNCGASIDGSKNLDINPTTDWTGLSTVTLRATDPGGLFGETTFDIIVAVFCNTCGETRNSPDGEWVVLGFGPRPTVTAVFPSGSFFYVEDESRASGIGANRSDLPTINHKVMLAGPMAAGPYGAERVINCERLWDQGADTTPPDPLGMTNRTMGGASPNAYTVAVPEGTTSGLYNVGLLIKTTGKVQYASPPGWFWVDDGSHVPPYSAGVLVQWGLFSGIPQPPLKARVAITGLSAAGLAGGSAVNILLPRSAADVKGLGGIVAYIYDTDVAATNAFYNMLWAHGWRQRSIPMSEVGTADLSLCDVIIIGADTGAWTNLDKVSAVLKSGKPVIAIYSGGGHFLDQVHSPELNIGWLPSGTKTTTYGYVDNPGLGTYYFDTPITIPPSNILDMYTSSTAAMSVYNPPTSVTKVLREMESTTYWPLAQEDRFMQWGYYASPTTMTTTAKALFVNCLYFMQGK